MVKEGDCAKGGTFQGASNSHKDSEELQTSQKDACRTRADRPSNRPPVQGLFDHWLTRTALLIRTVLLPAHVAEELSILATSMVAWLGLRRPSFMAIDERWSVVDAGDSGVMVGRLELPPGLGALLYENKPVFVLAMAGPHAGVFLPGSHPSAMHNAGVLDPRAVASWWSDDARLALQTAVDDLAHALAAEHERTRQQRATCSHPEHAHFADPYNCKGDRECTGCPGCGYCEAAWTGSHNDGQGDGSPPDTEPCCAAPPEPCDSELPCDCGSRAERPTGSHEGAVSHAPGTLEASP